MSEQPKSRKVTGRIDRVGYFKIYEWFTKNLDRIEQLTFFKTLEACRAETQVANLNSKTLKDIVRDMQLPNKFPWKRGKTSGYGEGHSVVRNNVSRFISRQLFYIGNELLSLKKNLNSPIDPKNKIRLDLLFQYANREINGEDANNVTEE